MDKPVFTLVEGDFQAIVRSLFSEIERRIRIYKRSSPSGRRQPVQREALLAAR